MKKIVSISILFFMVFNAYSQIGSAYRIFKSDYRDSQLGTYNAEEVDPFIVKDAETGDVDLVYTELANTANQTTYNPRPYYWNGFSSAYISGYAGHYFIRSQMHILSNGDWILNTAEKEGYFVTTDNFSGTYWNMRSTDSGSNWNVDNTYVASRHHKTIRSGDDVHILRYYQSGTSHNIQYMKRNSGGTYTGWSQIAYGSVLYQFMDLCIGPSNNPIFCYRDDSYSSVNFKPLSGSEVTVASSLSTQSTSWGNKLFSSHDPAIIYDSETGTILIAYCNYDTGSQLYRLYYSTSSNGGTSWTTPALVYSNSNHAIYPSLALNNELDCIYLSFLEIDDNDDVALEVITFYTFTNGFEDSPTELASLGDYSDSGYHAYPYRFIHSFYDESTNYLYIAAPYFEDEDDIDVALYRSLISTSQSVTFTNKCNGVNIGGNLLVNNSVEITSGNSTSLSVLTDHDVCTLNPQKDYSSQTYQHHHWNSSEDEYLLSNNFYSFNNGAEQDAQFYNISSVTINSSINAGIQLHDPWYLANPEDDPEEWVQPDCFRSISNGSYDVFLDQNEHAYANIPIYFLKADRIKVTTSDIQVFTGWTVTNGSANFVDGAGSTETRVVFEDAGATITANYSSAITNGLVVTINSGETLTIPTGATYNITPGNFSILVTGTGSSLIINESTSEQVTFQSNAGTPTNSDWGGIQINGSTLLMQHVTIKNAENPLNIEGIASNNLKYINNCTIEDCENGIYAYQASYDESNTLNNAITIKNNVLNRIGDDANENPGVRIDANIKVVEIDNNEINECYGGIYLSCDFTSTQVSTYTIPSEILISHNVIHDLFSDDYTACGIRVIDNSTKSSPYTLPYGKIVNNTIDGIDGYGIYMDRDDNGLWYVKNTIVTEIGEWDYGAGYAVYSSGYTLPVHYCCFNAVEETTYGCSTVSLIQDNPDYVSSTDYHLQNVSPCIDTGDPDTDDDSSTWENDSDDQDPEGTRMDIGAFYCDYPPDTPAGFNGPWYNNHPKVYWTAVSDPDLDVYEVWKRRDGVWSLRTTTTALYYVDNSEDKWTKPMTMETIDYRVRSVDEGENTSGFTSTESFIVNNVEYDKEIFNPFVEIEPIPTEFCLHPVFPNPFNITTTLKLDLPKKTSFSLVIYDINGSEVWCLNNRRNNTYRPGYHTIQWDGRNNSGSVVPTGVYFIVFNSPEHKLTQKVVLMK